MTDPKNESRYSADEKFDALMTSFFEAELPAARIQQRESRTNETSTVETNRRPPADPGPRRRLHHPLGDRVGHSPPRPG